MEHQATPIPPPPPVIVELDDVTPIVTYHKAFMSIKPSNFTSKEGLDRAKDWLKEVEKAFGIMEVPKRLKVRLETYMLIKDVKDWWTTLLEVRYSGEELAYVSQVAREKRIREFLDLTQRNKTLTEYVM